MAFTKEAARVGSGGTPRVALAVTAGVAAMLLVTGTFEQILAIAAALFLLVYLSGYLSLIKLRRSEPNLPRRYRAWGYPWATAVVICGTLLLLVAVIASDARSALIAFAAILLAIPLYRRVSRTR
jgi:basic amino acid/polyamine antiporter, APA family